MANFNSAYSKYYDALYKDKDYASESEYVAALIRRFKPDAATLLELGCGSGVHASLLAKKGFTITGIERSNEMIELARSKNIPGFTGIHGDIASSKLDQSFDVAISLFHVISYLTNQSDLINCFNHTNAHLNTGGLFVFDVWYSPAVYTQKPETRIRRIALPDTQITRIAESTVHPNTNTVDVHFEVHVTDLHTQQTTVINELHPMRHFSIPEIELLATHTGFQLLHTEEFATGKQPDASTWGICFVLQKTT